ncbi:MAG: hypothetical protein KA369_03760 [Spirochaetes bacterium]|nr:hypothetical protein [Spirochaetota bacterium]
MKKTGFLCVIVICAILGNSCAVSERKLRHYSSECAAAERAYKTIYSEALPKELYFAEYEGWIGDSRSFQLRRPVFVKIRFGGHGEGYYRLRKEEGDKHPFTMKIDRNNNIELTGSGGKGNMIHVFRGKEKDGTIKGVWRNGRGAEAFAFYVTVKRRYGPLSRR